VLTDWGAALFKFEYPVRGDAQRGSFGETAMNIVRACPTIGQHTGEIMREMDFSDAGIADNRDKKTIG
jgi:crotonobetainyl-CoA:carnitine CoA-transferase CaiB-like acyl-CoA transferase